MMTHRMPEKTPKSVVNKSVVNIPCPLHKRLRALCVAKGYRVGEFAARSIEHFVAREELGDRRRARVTR
jgi:hypothetical protein